MVRSPNYTQIPNEFFDDRMSKYSYWAFKVLMAISRKTFGFHRREDHISFSQLRDITGIPSNDTLYKAIQELSDDVEKYVKNGKTFYRIKMAPEIAEDYARRNGNECDRDARCNATVTPGVNTKETIKQIKSLLPIRAATDYFQSLYIKEYRVKPTWDGKVVKLLKADLARLGLETWEGLVSEFFVHPPDFVQKNATGKGYNIFHSMIDKMVAMGARRTDDSLAWVCGGCGEKYRSTSSVCRKCGWERV